jgi:SnoaL-like domain
METSLEEFTMSQLNDLIDRYFAVWNETNAERRRELIARTWTDTASYLDPLMQGDGRDGINAMVQIVQERFPGHKFRLTSAIDSHHDRVRFAWELAPDGGAAVAKGIDFGTVAGGQRLQTVTGFLDAATGA